MIKSKLEINNLELNVHLGWPNKEREKIQKVMINISLGFIEPPEACITDQLQDTLCYAELIDAIKIELTEKTFRLLEFFCAHLYQFIQKKLPENTLVQIKVRKFPNISDLKGGVQFTHGDVF